MEHLALEVFDLPTKENPRPTGSKFAVLQDEQSISVTLTSYIFDKGDAWAHSIVLNAAANVHIFGTATDLNGSRIHDILNNRRARLWMDGIPAFLGHLKLEDEVEVDEEGNVEMTLESGRKTFDDMIDGAKANQVPMIGKVRFGVALWRERWASYDLSLVARTTFTNRVSASVLSLVNDGPFDTIEAYGNGEVEGAPIQQYPSIVYPKGVFYNLITGNWNDSIDCLNTDYPYTEDANGTPTHPYCNIALCYQKYGYKKKNKAGETYDDYSNEPEAEREYEYMPANRVNSAPNFFVLYWIKALMKHLGIHIDENQMMDVEDLRRLFFVNTKCSYKKPKIVRGSNYDPEYGRYQFKHSSEILRLVPEQIDDRPLIKKDDSSFEGEITYISDPSYDHEYLEPSEIPTIDKINVEIKDVLWSDNQKRIYKENNSYLHDAYATSDCFPDADVSEVINAIENGFGVRFLFDENYERVRIVLLRNILRSKDCQEINCEMEVDEEGKVEMTLIDNSKRGFRMTYGDSEDTTFYYKGFADMLPHKTELWTEEEDEHDYSKWDLNARYSDVIKKVTAFNKTCYVTPNNGNAYGVKVDNDAKRYEDLHPSLFEYAGFMDAEDGDCTGDEETIETINVGFKPAIMNDLNATNEREKYDYTQRFALFVDEKMRPRRPDLKDLPHAYEPDVKSYDDPRALYDVNEMYKMYGPKGSSDNMSSDGVVKPGEYALTSDMYLHKEGLNTTVIHYIWKEVHEFSAWFQVTWNVSLNISGHLNEGYRLYLQDNFEPNDDGVCPIENHDWGLTLGIMRGSGNDAYVKYGPDIDDGEDNETWDIVPGSSATAHPDTCDNYGNEWDYNGSILVTAGNAESILAAEFPDSNAPFYTESIGYIVDYDIVYIKDNNGNTHRSLMVYQYTRELRRSWLRTYAQRLNGLSIADIMAYDADGRDGRDCIVELDSSDERGRTLVRLCRYAFGKNPGESWKLENGVGEMYGRISLKLRSEKPNPYYDATQPESASNRKYLEITNENLRQRGLADQFYKEYSYLQRNGRVLRIPVHMTLAQLLAIDMSVKANIGGITGFIKKIQYTVNTKTGLGTVKIDILYI